MKTKRQVLVVTEGTPSLRKLRHSLCTNLSDVLDGEADIVEKDFSDFVAVDLLRADAYFFGARQTGTLEFAEFARVIRGINLAGRPCGLFSDDSRVGVDGLSALVADAEPRINPAFFIASEAGSDLSLMNWIAETLGKR